MTKDEILKKYEDDREYHFHQVDREWIMECMQEYADQQLRLYSVMYIKNGMNTPNPEKTHYTIWKFKETDNEFQIDGRNLVYCQLGEHHHGCQCMHTGDKPEHKEITNKLKQICELFTEIEKLNKP